MNESNFTDVDYEEIDPEVTYTAVQVAKIIQEDISTVRSWCSSSAFEEELNIKRVNGRRIYSAKDIENLKFIKALREKNMPIKQIKNYISKQGFKYREYDAGLIDPKDPNGFDVLADRILEKNTNYMKDFLKKLIQYNEDFKNELLQEQRRVNQEFRDEILEQHEALLKGNKNDIENLNNQLLIKIDDNNNKIKEDLKSRDEKLKDELNNFISDTIKEHTTRLTEEIKNTNVSIEESAQKRDLELIEKLKNSMDVNKEIAIELEATKEKQPFWSKWFKK